SGSVLILAARDPAVNTRLLESFDAQRVDIEWVAASNLLAEHAPHRVAPALVQQVRVEIIVSVLDPNTGSGRGGSNRTISCGGAEAPDGFPPSVVYTLNERRSGAPDAFADGPVAIGYDREVHGAKKFGLGRQVRAIDRAEYSLRLLRWIAGDRAL